MQRIRWSLFAGLALLVSTDISANQTRTEQTLSDQTRSDPLAQLIRTAQNLSGHGEPQPSLDLASAQRKYKDDPASSLQSQRPKAQQVLVELYQKGNYREVGLEGIGLLENKVQLDEQLRLFIANSLAWTGRLQAAMTAYQGLETGPFKLDALLGMANLHRWQGREHKALALYKEILAVDPSHRDALEGVRLSQRELRPRSTLRWGSSIDSSDIHLRTLLKNLKWRDQSQAQIYEVEVSGSRVNNSQLDVDRREVTFRYNHQELALQPKVELTSDSKTFYGLVKVDLAPTPLMIDLGRVNWGKAANNPAALAKRLTATQAGIQGALEGAHGNLRARVAHYGISDGNTISTSTIQFTSSWRPFGSNLKPFFGIETRDAKFSTSDYWAPADGYGLAYLGMLGEWGSDEWEIYLAGQVGTRVYGEAGKSWSVSAGAKRWLDKDWLVGMNYWAMTSKRNNSPYRARSFYLTMERLWQ